MSVYIRRQRQNHDSQLSFKTLHQIIRSLHESVTQGTWENPERLYFFVQLNLS